MNKILQIVISIFFEYLRVDMKQISPLNIRTQTKEQNIMNKSRRPCIWCFIAFDSIRFNWRIRSSEPISVQSKISSNRLSPNIISQSNKSIVNCDLMCWMIHCWPLANDYDVALAISSLDLIDSSGARLSQPWALSISLNSTQW